MAGAPLEISLKDQHPIHSFTKMAAIARGTALENKPLADAANQQHRASLNRRIRSHTPTHTNTSHSSRTWLLVLHVRCGGHVLNTSLAYSNALDSGTAEVSEASQRFGQGCKQHLF